MQDDQTQDWSDHFPGLPEEHKEPFNQLMNEAHGPAPQFHDLSNPNLEASNIFSDAWNHLNPPEDAFAKDNPGAPVLGKPSPSVSDAAPVPTTPAPEKTQETTAQAPSEPEEVKSVGNPWHTQIGAGAGIGGPPRSIDISPEEEAVEAQKAAALDAAKDEAARQKFEVDELQKNESQHQQDVHSALADFGATTDEIMAHRKMLDEQSQRIMNQQIDPDRAWHNKDAGQKALTLIGLAFGTLGQAIGHLPTNEVAKMVAQEVADDNAAQEHNIANQHWGIQEQKGSLNADQEAAQSSLKSQLMSADQKFESVKAATALKAKEVGTPEAIATAQEVNAKLDVEAAKYRLGLEAQGMKTSRYSRGFGVAGGPPAPASGAQAAGSVSGPVGTAPTNSIDQSNANIDAQLHAFHPGAHAPPNSPEGQDYISRIMDAIKPAPAAAPGPAPAPAPKRAPIAPPATSQEAAAPAAAPTAPVSPVAGPKKWANRTFQVDDRGTHKNDPQANLIATNELNQVSTLEHAPVEDKVRIPYGNEKIDADIVRVARNPKEAADVDAKLDQFKKFNTAVGAANRALQKGDVESAGLQILNMKQAYEYAMTGKAPSRAFISQFTSSFDSDHLLDNPDPAQTQLWLKRWGERKIDDSGRKRMIENLKGIYAEGQQAANETLNSVPLKARGFDKNGNSIWWNVR